MGKSGSSSGTVIVLGGAIGIDSSYAEACGELGIEHEAPPARWNDLDHSEAVIRHDRQRRAYCSKAGLIRNAEMEKAGAEMCLAFHREISASRGTKDCARRAIEAEIPTYLIGSEVGKPKRLRAGDARLK